MEALIKKPKTRRGKRVLEKRAPQTIENTKRAMFIRGGRTSEVVTQTLKDLCALKKPDAVMFQRRNILRPFDDPTSLEFFGLKNDASLFVFGSHSKKRPHNLVIGRCFDGHVLDMLELGIEKFIPLRSFKTEKCGRGTKPCLLFCGEPFENENEYKKLKNVLIDFFRGAEVNQLRLQGLEHILQFTAVDGKILLRSYRVLLKKSGVRTPRVELDEMGPSLDLVLRRTKLASEDLMKEAQRVPKVVKPKKVKNVAYDVYRSKTGRVHMERQDYSKLQTRKLKGLKRSHDNTSSSQGPVEGGPRKKKTKS